jgi:hypothetical protein
MSGDQYSTRLTRKDKRKLERYRDVKGVSKAEALRHGVRELERDGDENDVRDWLAPQVRNWGAVLVSSTIIVILSNAGVLPDIVETLTGLVLLPALVYTYLKSFWDA